jgi:transposase
VNLFAFRSPDPVIHTKRVPQEEQRLPLPQAFLHRAVQDLKEYVQECTTELVFNLDEVGVSDWEDGKMRNICVQATMGDEAIVHGISRNARAIRCQ